MDPDPECSKTYGPTDPNSNPDPQHWIQRLPTLTILPPAFCSVGLGDGDTAPAASAIITFAPFGVDFYTGSGKAASSYVCCTVLYLHEHSRKTAVLELFDMRLSIVLKLKGIANKDIFRLTVLCSAFG